MRSILRLWAWILPVLIGRRDEEHGPLVQLRLLPSPSGSLPPLRSRQHLLLRALRRHGAPALSAPFRAALPGQPPGPSQACGAPAALSRTSRRRRAPENRASGQKVTHHPLTRTGPRPVLARPPPGRPGTRPFSLTVFRVAVTRFALRPLFAGSSPGMRRISPSARAWKRSTTYLSSSNPLPKKWTRNVAAVLPGIAIAACMVPLYGRLPMARTDLVYLTGRLQFLYGRLPMARTDLVYLTGRLQFLYGRPPMARTDLVYLTGRP